MATELQELCDEYDRHLADFEPAHGGWSWFWVLILFVPAMLSLLVSVATGNGFLTAIWLFVSILSLLFFALFSFGWWYQKPSYGPEEQLGMLRARIKHKRAALLAAMNQS